MPQVEVTESTRIAAIFLSCTSHRAATTAGAANCASLLQ